ncbi:MAG TPA: DUF547 domain-containing protein [Saprospiraceae bacterium]|nr:DUF547 domain-containing protein [Saprospiraceae bacterium]
MNPKLFIGFIFIMFFLMHLEIKGSSPLQLIDSSGDLLLAIKDRNTDSAGIIVRKLKKLDMATLINDLDNDHKKKAFWTNIYNAYVAYRLLNDPSEYDNRNQFFKTKSIVIANEAFSFDDIEHVILRRGRHKLSRGYFNRFHTPKKLKKLMVDTLDYRIHFVLNCGALSCPPVNIYTAENIDREFQEATRAYLLQETEFDPDKNIVRVPVLMDWFLGDFNGRKGILSILVEFGIIERDANPTIRFKPYHWDLKIGI